ncbi:aldehyde dehydrogenase family protein [Kozakia baliensis]|uniref:aldehyde dehydrogenase family protein n=1 Tax=Kozakia baliensis TaxID=153496 RepID=UPI000A9BA017|nr:aldehyde dehydrogenase family protein [Kozakia baliensis]GEL65655.1 aldehyde dehydrogenase [Kozakia baliensis]
MKNIFDDESESVSRLREAASLWADVPIRRRIKIVRRFERYLTKHVGELRRFLPERPFAQTIVAEFLPLQAACRFLSREAAPLLKPHALGWRGRPFWLIGTSAIVERRPFGVVLILGPGNYPLMLPGIQILQALVAGNAVAFKPAPGYDALAHFLLSLLKKSGLPASLVRLLPSDQSSELLKTRYDLVVLTGSANTGRDVALKAAKTLTPTIMELSGVDAVFVLPDADLSLVARALAFGSSLNHGATCIAPHRVFVTPQNIEPLAQALRATLKRKSANSPSGSTKQLAAAIERAGGRAEFIGGVALLRIDHQTIDLLNIDIFQPWLALVEVASMEEAVQLDRRSDYALGASLFGPEQECEMLARRLAAGSICINDLIVPTADPRLPFGGKKNSGWGVTRGREGLLAMTRPVAISKRHRFAFHLR